MAGEPVDVLGMSDSDFLQLNEPPVASTEEATEVVDTPETTEEVVVESEQSTEDPAAETEEEEEPSTEEVNPLDDKAPVTKEEPVQAEPSKAAGVVDADKIAFYDKAMKSFKANGKQIEVRSPEELIQLAQMGCNYTAKMQQIAPHRKVLLMLENNGLLDEGKLSYLIDLDKKNPEAIKKLLKDGNIDPLDIDTQSASNYQEGNHRVGEEEVNFRTALDDVKSQPKGIETLQILNSTWDQASKDMLFKNPDIMSIMHQQRELGVYDRIVSEIDRQKVLGTVSANESFIKLYEHVGKQMAEAGYFNDLDVPERQAATPVATRAATPKPVVSNNDKASAASQSRATPRTAKVLVNPLAMSDEDFLKEMAGRL
ncbi:MAG: hypothetical protein WC117_00045 [Sphaerochaetaceae bacterium]